MKKNKNGDVVGLVSIKDGNLWIDYVDKDEGNASWSISDKTSDIIECIKELKKAKRFQGLTTTSAGNLAQNMNIVNKIKTH